MSEQMYLALTASLACVLSLVFFFRGTKDE